MSHQCGLKVSMERKHNGPLYCVCGLTIRMAYLSRKCEYVMLKYRQNIDVFGFNMMAYFQYKIIHVHINFIDSYS